VRRARFSPDGRRVAVATGDTTTVWATATGERLESLRGHARATVDMAFSPDAATLYTSDEIGTTLVWDLDGGQRFAPRRAVIDAVPSSVTQVAIAPNGRYAALNWVQTDAGGVPHGWLQVVDLGTGRTKPPVDTGHSRYHGPAWRPDSGQLATAGEDGYVRTWTQPPASFSVNNSYRTSTYPESPTPTTASASSSPTADCCNSTPTGCRRRSPS
jgi:WD40 repeat protein